MTDAPTPEAAGPLFHCSFCFKSQEDVVKLIAGPGVMICNDCVALCATIVAQEPSSKLPPTSIRTPTKTPTEQLLKMLASYNTAFEKVDRSMQDIVDILRARDVSWATLGERLGVSRQAAWKRFG